MLSIATALLVATVTTVTTLTAGDTSRESSSSEIRSKELIQTLRRQLMRDNSDYPLQRTIYTERIHMRAEPELGERDTNGYNYYVTNIKNFGNDRHGINDGVQRNVNEVTHSVSEKDLLYYIDDDKLTSKKPDGHKYFENGSIKNTSVSDVKYKTLKFRHQYRRVGQNRYIQEEGKEGVAIVSLDTGGPFPELRLPQSRRQYRHDPGEAMTDDEEVPPPPVDTSDPEAAADDATPRTAI